MTFLRNLKASKYYQFRVVVELILDKTIGLFMFQYERRDNMFNWFYNCLKYQHDNPDFAPQYNYYEFGVASGGSMKIYILALQKFCKDYGVDIKKYHIFGFDSFQGLPEAEEADKRTDWQKGTFVYGKEVVLDMIKEVGFPPENVHLVEGFFENSLTQKLKDDYRKYVPAIVNMDADYYSSTVTVFNWLQDSLASGTYFRFDDMWSFYGHPEKGVIKAINEFNKGSNGYLTPFPVFGLPGNAFVYARENFEYQ